MNTTIIGRFVYLTSARGRRYPTLLLTLALLNACGEGEQAAPLLEIPVTAVIQRDVPIEYEFVGQTLGSVDIPIRARVEGFLEGIHFREGRPVTAEQLLYTIDSRPFQAKVVEAQGYVAEARTQLAKARSDLNRVRPLARMRAVSEQDLDSAVAQHDAAKASLQAAEARLEQAEIDLGYTRIFAPIAGLIGISQAKEGEYVGASPNPVVLNYVSKIDPIRVRFAIDERRFLRFARLVADMREALAREDEEGDGQASARLRKGKIKRELDLILADGSLHDHKGQVVTSDAAINPETGTFTMEADFPNPRGVVIAGQFARVRSVVETRENALLVPQRAVSEMQGMFRVFVVRPDDTVELREITPGQRIGSLWLVEAGLQPEERVAVEAIQRLRDGMTIAPIAVSSEPVGGGD